MEEVMDTVVTPVKSFAKDSIRLINKCTKPDRKGAWGENNGTTERARGGATASAMRTPRAGPRAEVGGAGRRARSVGEGGAAANRRSGPP